MKKSIKLRLLVILSLFAAGIISFYIILNNLALENYYILNKKDLLVKTYITINDLYNSDTSNIEEELERLDVNKSLNIVVTDGDIIIYSRAKGEYNRIGERGPKFQDPYNNVPYTAPNNTPKNNIGRNNVPLNAIMQPPEAVQLYSDNNCTIIKEYNKFFRSFHIDLSAKLDNGYILFIRSPMESITESVKITNKFIIIIGIFAILIGALISIIIAKSFTRPILKLSSIAKEMSQLNFNIKYDIKGQDEINDLGNSINTLSEKLERTISELKTANAQLQKDIEIKNNIDDMRRGFLSNVSHELKTPISLIQGYAEGLKENVADNEESKNFYCDVILDESEKMDRIIRKLLTLMQIESGQDPVTIRRFEITDIIKSLLSKNQIHFEQNNINVKFNGSKTIYVWGDEFLIEDVLRNYISNAINHVNDKKTIEIKITSNEKTARISVFNTGKHIPVEDLDRIWESFYKVDKARTREYGGSGIGLSVVSAIMKAIGKPYGVENVKDGVEFYIELDL